MKTTKGIRRRRCEGGYVSYVMVLTLGMFAFTRWQEARARRLKFAQQEEG